MKESKLSRLSTENKDLKESILKAKLGLLKELFMKKRSSHLQGSLLRCLKKSFINSLPKELILMLKELSMFTRRIITSLWSIMSNHFSMSNKDHSLNLCIIKLKRFT
jgi:hypothetical protein